MLLKVHHVDGPRTDLDGCITGSVPCMESMFWDRNIATRYHFFHYFNFFGYYHKVYEVDDVGEVGF